MAMIGSLVVLGVSLVVVLSHSATRASGHNNIYASDAQTRTIQARSRFCQDAESLPEGTSSIRVSLSSDPGPGPAVRLRVSKGGRTAASGRVAPGWSGRSATVPIQPVERAVHGALVCVSTGPGAPTTLLGSSHTKIGAPWTGGTDPVDDRPIGHRFRIDYLRAGRATWWGLAPTMARRLGLNTVVRGPWAALLAIALMVAATTLVTLRLLRDLPPDRPSAKARGDPQPPDLAPPAQAGGPTRLARALALPRKLPTAAWICALVAILNAATWSILSPPFQFLDEQDHYAYVQHLVDTGKPPTDRRYRFPQDLSRTLHDVRYLTVRESSDNVPIWSSFERDRLDRTMARPLSRTDRQGAGTATGQPPLAYALAAVPYELASGGTVLDRLLLMRLLSALFAGVTALFVFLFVREALPGVPWAWTAAGLAAALQPLFGFAAGAVNSDSLLFATSAALFYCIARAFRRGLSVRLSVATGLVLAGGLLTKFTFAGIVPGAIAALLLLALRQAPSRTPSGLLRALRLPATAFATALVPFLMVAALNAAVWDQPTFGVATAGSDVVAQTSTTQNGSLSRELGLIWQFYLPRLPGMAKDIDSPLPVKTIWLEDFAGSFGWRTIGPPKWVVSVALVLALIALYLAGLGLARSSRDLRRRLLELAAYALMVLGLLVMIGMIQYSSVSQGSNAWYGQSRYLLPLLAPFAAMLALAARGAGRRWGPVMGVLIVMLVLTHDVHSQLLTVAHYFG
jgi:hypothetical protein